MNELVEALFRTLPRKIKVGAYDWRIVLSEEAGDVESIGECDFEHHTITLQILHLNSPDHAVGLLIHELLHAFWYNSELERNTPLQEEQIIIAFEHGLVSLFRDNPRLLTWIKRGLK